MNLRNFHSSRRMTRRSSTCRSALLMVLPKRRNNLYISILPGVLSVASVHQRLWMARRALLMAGAGASGAGLGAAGSGAAGSGFMGALAGAGSGAAGSVFMGASAGAGSGAAGSVFMGASAGAGSGAAGSVFMGASAGAGSGASAVVASMPSFLIRLRRWLSRCAQAVALFTSSSSSVRPEPIPGPLHLLKGGASRQCVSRAHGSERVAIAELMLLEQIMTC